MSRAARERDDDTSAETEVARRRAREQHVQVAELAGWIPVGRRRGL